MYNLFITHKTRPNPIEYCSDYEGIIVSGFGAVPRCDGFCSTRLVVSPPDNYRRDPRRVVVLPSRDGRECSEKFLDRVTLPAVCSVK